MLAKNIIIRASFRPQFLGNPSMDLPLARHLRSDGASGAPDKVSRQSCVWILRSDSTLASEIFYQYQNYNQHQIL